MGRLPTDFILDALDVEVDGCNFRRRMLAKDYRCQKLQIQEFPPRAKFIADFFHDPPRRVVVMFREPAVQPTCTFCFRKGLSRGLPTDRRIAVPDLLRREAQVAE